MEKLLPLPDRLKQKAVENLSNLIATYDIKKFSFENGVVTYDYGFGRYATFKKDSVMFVMHSPDFDEPSGFGIVEGWHRYQGDPIPLIVPEFLKKIAVERYEMWVEEIGEIRRIVEDE